MRQILTSSLEETVVVSKRTLDKAMDHSEGNEPKRSNRPQQEQPIPGAQQLQVTQQEQQRWLLQQQAGQPQAYGVVRQQQAQQLPQPYAQQHNLYNTQQARLAGATAPVAPFPGTVDVPGLGGPYAPPHGASLQPPAGQLQQAPYQQPYPAAFPPPQQYPPAQQLLFQQQQQQQAMAIASAGVHAGYVPQQPLPQPQPTYMRPKVGRLPADRPLMKLSVSLIDTYKQINTVYYEERDARRAARAKEKASKGHGTNNNGWDDENYDYIVTPGELFNGRYKMMERIGKGSFGQVVRAEDIETKREVAIKIIKSKKPFLMQAKTEIELLTHLFEKDPHDDNNLGKLKMNNRTRLLFPPNISLIPLVLSSIHSPFADSFHVSQSPMPCVRNAVTEFI